jgi:signal transduction histidine kinase
MNIRQNLALKFCLIVATLFVLFAFALYYFSSSYRASEFHIRMKNRGKTVVNLFSDVKQIDNTLLQSINAKTENALFDETVSIFGMDNHLLFSDSEDSLNQQIEIKFLGDINGSDRVFNLEKKEVVGFLYAVKEKQFKVVVAAYDKYGIDNIRNLKIILFVGLLLSIFLSYVAGWFFSGLALMPISKIINDANEITVSKLNLRLSEGNKKDEIAQLSMTFNRVLDRLEKGFEMQRTFISNASHELRTPLTSITGHIEVTLKKERSTIEYIELLESLLIDIKNLSKISNNLLDLALATTDIGALKLKNIRVDEVLFSAKERLIKNIPTYKIVITFHSLSFDEMRLTVFGNESLIESAFFNLMENACKYSANNAVEVLFEVMDEHIVLLFKDNGIGIPYLEITKIAEPFYRATNARNWQGSGLGLSLTKKIIELHKGDIQIHSIENEGTEIKVVLPTTA